MIKRLGVTTSLVSGVMAVVLSGCMVDSGDIVGVMKDGQSVVLHYDGNFYQTVIDGEMFSGRAADVDQSMTRESGVSWNDSWGWNNKPFGPWPYNSGHPDWIDSTKRRSSGKFEALLIGSMGSTLTCKLQYVNTTSPSSGGVGHCMLSDGRNIQVSW